MTNHPNRSQSASLRYIVYSLGSCIAVASCDSLDSALAYATRQFGDTDLTKVFTTRSRDALERFDGGRWPRDAEIVFRGANELAQR